MLRIYMFRTSEKKTKRREKKLEKQQQLKTTKSLFYFVFVIFRHEEISLTRYIFSLSTNTYDNDDDSITHRIGVQSRGERKRAVLYSCIYMKNYETTTSQKSALFSPIVSFRTLSLTLFSSRSLSHRL